MSQRAFHHLRPNRARDPRARRAFTLIEILMVVVILGIASAIIVPQIGSRDDLRAAAAARVIMSDLIYAQNRSITFQKKHYVRFTGQQYCVSDNTALTPIDHPLKPAIHSGKYIEQFGSGGNPGLESATLGTITIGGTSTLGFNDLGEPFTYNGVTETPLSQPAKIIVQSGAFSLTIQVEPFTGECSVQ